MCLQYPHSSFFSLSEKGCGRRCLDVRESVSSDSRLGDHTSQGNHSQTSVLQFLQLHFLVSFFGLGLESKRIKAKFCKQVKTTVVSTKRLWFALKLAAKSTATTRKAVSA